MRACELDETLPSLGAQRAAARVLKGRDRVEEGGFRTVRERLRERVELEPFVVHRDCRDVDATCRE